MSAACTMADKLQLLRSAIDSGVDLAFLSENPQVRGCAGRSRLDAGEIGPRGGRSMLTAHRLLARVNLADQQQAEDVGPARAGRGLPRPEVGAGGGHAAPRSGAALIWYGLTRQCSA